MTKHLYHDYTPELLWRQCEGFAEGKKYTVSDSIRGQAESVLHSRLSVTETLDKYC